MTDTPLQGQVQCLSSAGFHSMAYWMWHCDAVTGEDGIFPVVCAHGLTRNGRDFDDLARSLSQTRPVVCPDTAGRGESEWLRDPALYTVPHYAADMTTLIARLDTEAVDWVGTSMGGLIGMVLAAMPGSPIRRLVVNDVGPVIPQVALDRIGDYLGIEWVYDSFDEAVQHTKTVHAPFGDLTEEQWRHLAYYGFRQRDDGKYVPNHDRRLGEAFKSLKEKDIDLWTLFEAIECPVLVVRGAESDLLTAPIADAMVERGKDVRVVTFDGCGHAPPFMSDDQIDTVQSFFADF